MSHAGVQTALGAEIPHTLDGLLVLGAPGGDSAYALFSAVHGRRHESHADFSNRLGAFQRSVGLIAAHNGAPNKSYTLAINKFADWSEVWGRLHVTHRVLMGHTTMRCRAF